MKAASRRPSKSPGSIDVLVNNAGIGVVGAFEATPMSRIRKVFDTNTFGVMAMTQAVIPQMRERRSGVIVNVTSSATLAPMPLAAAYTASKQAIEGFTGSLAHELAHFNILLSCRAWLRADPEFAQNASVRIEDLIPAGLCRLRSPDLSRQFPRDRRLPPGKSMSLRPYGGRSTTAPAIYDSRRDRTRLRSPAPRNHGFAPALIHQEAGARFKRWRGTGSDHAISAGPDIAVSDIIARGAPLGPNFIGRDASSADRLQFKICTKAGRGQRNFHGRHYAVRVFTVSIGYAAQISKRKH